MAPQHVSSLRYLGVRGTLDLGSRAIMRDALQSRSLLWADLPIIHPESGSRLRSLRLPVHRVCLTAINTQRPAMWPLWPITCLLNLTEL